MNKASKSEFEETQFLLGVNFVVTIKKEHSQSFSEAQRITLLHDYTTRNHLFATISGIKHLSNTLIYRKHIGQTCCDCNVPRTTYINLPS